MTEPLRVDADLAERNLYRVDLAKKVLVSIRPGQNVSFWDGLQKHPLQQEMLFRDWRYFVAPCGRRSGKTIGAAFWLTEGLSHPDFRQWAVAPDYDSTDRIFEYVYKWVVIDECFGPGSVKKAQFGDQHRFIEMAWGAFLKGKSCESKSLRGEKLDRMVLDEAALIKESRWTSELRPCLLDRKGSAIFISTPRARNWFYDYFQRRLDPEMQRKGWAGFTMPSTDNPFIDAEEVEADRLTMPPDEFRREYEASFEHFTGLIYPMFRDRLHTQTTNPGHLFDPKETELPPGTDYRAIDIGWRHPTVCLWMRAVKYPEDDIYIYREYTGVEGTTHEEHAKNISTLTAGEKICDTWISPDAKRKHGLHTASEQRTCAWDIYRDLGIYSRPAVDDVGAGVDIVRSYLASTLRDSSLHPRVFISTECPDLRRGILDYVYQEVHGRSEVDQPEKPRKYKDDHTDTLRYGLAAKPRYIASWHRQEYSTDEDRYGHQHTESASNRSLGGAFILGDE